MKNSIQKIVLVAIVLFTSLNTNAQYLDTNQETYLDLQQLLVATKKAKSSTVKTIRSTRSLLISYALQKKINPNSAERNILNQLKGIEANNDEMKFHLEEANDINDYDLVVDDLFDLTEEIDQHIAEIKNTYLNPYIDAVSNNKTTVYFAYYDVYKILKLIEKKVDKLNERTKGEIEFLEQLDEIPW